MTGTSRHFGSNHLHSNILFYLEVCFWLFVLCCASVAIPATVLPCAVINVTALALGWFSVMGKQCFPNAEKEFVDPGKERAERVLAGAIAIDGRKERVCKICSESKVWTRCPAGLRRKYWQAVAARTGEWSTFGGEEDRKAKSQEAEIKELRAQIEQYRKQSGGAEQGGQGLSTWKRKWLRGSVGNGG